MAKSKKGKNGLVGQRIVPAKVVLAKVKRSKKKAAPGVSVDPTCCDLLCPTPGQAGFVVTTPTGCGRITPPQAGGPWIPAVNPATQTFVWINGGGL